MAQPLSCERAEETPVIVLVDDDPAVLNAMEFAFRAEGYPTRSFPSGAALLESDLPQKACLVIDQVMPFLTGLETLAVLRIRGATWPAILVTTNPSRKIMASAKDVRARIVEKPLLGDELLSQVREELAQCCCA